MCFAWSFFRTILRRRWLRWVLAACATVLLCAALVLLAGYGIGRASLPQTAGEATLSALDNRGVIRFDSFQRPYVHAESLSDALAIEGWLHASHRLWQMELFRRAGRGRLAELLGPSMLEADRSLYRIGVPQLGQALKRKASVEFVRRIEAYMAGVNAGIAQLSVRPPEFLLISAKIEPWTLDDVYAVGALMAFQSANNLQNELLRLDLRGALDAERSRAFLTDRSDIPDYPFVLRPAAQGALPPRGMRVAALPARSSAAEPLAVLEDRLAALDTSQNRLMPRLSLGSNSWVVAPRMSTTGHALFAFDSHDELGLPNLFYEVHLFYGEGKQIRGWSVAGLPGVINGYNHRIAWGFTNIGDTQDLFLETQHPKEPDQFRDGEGWYTARREEYALRVAGRSAPERLTVRYTKNGPLIQDSPPIALRWTAHEIGARGLDAFLELNLAENWAQFNAALDGVAAPSLNAIYADVDGNIGFRTAGILPIRAVGDGLIPIAGDSQANRWLGTIPASQMPRSLNPPAGYLAAANARVNAAGDGPLVSADNAPAYRIGRIQRVLSAQGPHRLDDMARLQVDWHDGQAEILLPTLLAAVSTAELSPAAGQAVAILREWGSRLDASADSPGALIFQAWYVELARELFAEPLGEALFQRLLKRNYVLNHALDSIVLEEAPEWWRDRKAARLAASLERTVAELTQRLGPHSRGWRLDQVQHLTLAHELSKAEPRLARLFNVGPRSLGGGPATVGRASYRYDRAFEVMHGATVRVVIDMSSPPEAGAVIPAGQSGHPLSAHYADQLDAWLGGRLIPIPEAASDVAGEIVTLVPEGVPARRSK